MPCSSLILDTRVATIGVGRQWEVVVVPDLVSIVPSPPPSPSSSSLLPNDGVGGVAAAVIGLLPADRLLRIILNLSNGSWCDTSLVSRKAVTGPTFGNQLDA